MEQRHSIGERLALPAVFFLIAVILIARAVQAGATAPLFVDTDDAMRMVVVHDFLAGQNWFDHLQHRLNTPFGAELHWSRLVDLPIAGLLLLLRPLFGPALADLLAGFIYPLALLFVLLWLLAHLARRLIGSEGVLAVLVLPLFTPPVISEFTPGRMDHHNVQILLALGLLAALLAALDRPRYALLAGLLAATSLAIGTEGITLVAAAILALGLIWVVTGTRTKALRYFGLAFGACAVVHLALYLPPSRWLEPACDALSPVYVFAAIGTGAGFILLSLLPLRSLRSRLLLAVLVGGALVAGLLLAFPHCLKGPYAGLDPWLVSHWLDRITEVQPLAASLLALSPMGVGIALPLLLAAMALVLILRRPGPQRLAWSVVALFFIAAALVALFQIRGGRLALPVAILPLAWLIAAARKRYLADNRPGSAALLILAWLGSAGLVSMLVVALVLGWRDGSLASAASADPAPAEATAQACQLPPAFADLAGLPPERIMAPIDLGAHILLNTDHAVVAAPYHRNQRGVRDTFAFFNEKLQDQRAMLAERGIGLVVVCPAMPELRPSDLTEEGSFIALYPGSLPDWLVDQSLEGSPLKIYAVLSARP